MKRHLADKNVTSFGAEIPCAFLSLKSSLIAITKLVLSSRSTIVKTGYPARYFYFKHTRYFIYEAVWNFLGGVRSSIAILYTVCLPCGSTMDSLSPLAQAPRDTTLHPHLVLVECIRMARKLICVCYIECAPHTDPSSN